MRSDVVRVFDACNSLLSLTFAEKQSLYNLLNDCARSLIPETVVDYFKCKQESLGITKAFTFFCTFSVDAYAAAATVNKH